MFSIFKKMTQLASGLLGNARSTSPFPSDSSPHLITPQTAPSVYPTNRFRFSLEKSQYRGQTYGVDMDEIQNRAVKLARIYFPNAMIKTHIEAAAFDNHFSTPTRNFFIIIIVADSSMPKDDFDEAVADFRQAIKTF